MLFIGSSIFIFGTFCQCLEILVKPEEIDQYDATIYCFNNKEMELLLTADKGYGNDKQNSINSREALMLSIPNLLFTECATKMHGVMIRITKDEKHKDFGFSKNEISTRKSAIVLNFDVDPMAHKTFLIDQRASLIATTSAALADPLVLMIEYELELICYLQTKNNPDGKLFYFIGSGIQLRNQKGIHVPLYDREVLNLCKKIAIDVIYNGTRRRINIQKENDFILNSIFKIDIDTQTAYPAGHSNLKNSRPQLRIPERNFGSIGSLSLTSPASSTLTSELPSPNESNQNAKTPSTNEQSNKKINCIECLENIRDTVFLPCKHLGTCDSCAKKILDSTEKQCPGCGSQIKETLKINFL